MKISQEDRERFGDISWLMPMVDVVNVLERLDVRLSNQIGDEVWGWCPDHYMFVHRYPSHPKWSVNIKTGKSKCLTEDRGSNLIYIVARLRKCSPKEAVEWMVGEGVLDEAKILGMERDLAGFKIKPPTPKKTIRGLIDIENMIKTGSMNEDGYEFFMRPPGKKPTLIERVTVDHFGCVFAKNGFYSNRVIIPCNQKGELAGFVALDILGKDEWTRKHPTLDPEKEYRKVLFPYGMERGKILFGFDECKVGEEVIAIVEGAREVMKLWQLGYRALAVQGSGITSDQINLLAELNPGRVVIMMDGDIPGYEAERKIFDKLIEYFRVFKGNTPHGHDPKTLDPTTVEKIMRL